MFRFIAIVTAAICVVLFVLLLIAPAVYMETYGVTADPAGIFMTQRASPMFLGFATILWLARDCRPSQLRSAICFGISAAFMGVALTGIADYVQGTATAMILAAAAGEIVFAVLFWRAGRIS